MHHSKLLSLTCNNPGRAAVLEQFIFLERTGRSKEGWIKTNRPRLREFISRTISICLKSISRHIAWLEEHGFIRVRRVFTARGWQLYVRVLIRLKEAAVPRVSLGCPEGVPSKLIDLSTSDYSPAGKQPTTGTAGSHPDIQESRLSGRVDGAADRVKALREERARKQADEPVTPYKLGRVWNHCLVAEGYEVIPFEGKTLAHLKAAIPFLKAKRMGEVAGRVTEVIEQFERQKANFPEKHRRMPPHPWVCNRYPQVYDPLVQSTLDVPAAASPTPTPPPAKPIGKPNNPFFNALTKGTKNAE